MVDNRENYDSEDSQKNGNNNKGNTVECTDFAAKLIELQAEMEQAIADLEYQKRKQVNSAADFKELEKIIGEIDTIVSTYSNARVNLKNGLDKQENYYCKKQDMIIAAVGDKEREIENVIKACEANIDALDGEVKAKKLAKENAESCFNASKQLLDAKTACFNQWKERKGHTEAIITSLNKLQGQIEKKESESKFAVMYYLLTKFCKALKEFKDAGMVCGIAPPIVGNDDDFKNGLKNAWCEMHKANKDKLNKRDAFDEATRILESAEANSQTAKDQLDSNIIQKMEEIDVNCA